MTGPDEVDLDNEYDSDPDGIDDEFDCPRFPTPDGDYCPLQGTEECEWDCPY